MVFPMERAICVFDFLLKSHQLILHQGNIDKVEKVKSPKIGVLSDEIGKCKLDERILSFRTEELSQAFFGILALKESEQGTAPG